MTKTCCWMDLEGVDGEEKLKSSCDLGTRRPRPRSRPRCSGRCYFAISPLSISRDGLVDKAGTALNRMAHLIGPSLQLLSPLLGNARQDPTVLACIWPVQLLSDASASRKLTQYLADSTPLQSNRKRDPVFSGCHPGSASCVAFLVGLTMRPFGQGHAVPCQVA